MGELMRKGDWVAVAEGHESGTGHTVAARNWHHLVYNR